MTMKAASTIIQFLLCSISYASAASHGLTWQINELEIKTANIDGADMDRGFWGIGGGTYTLNICSNFCCNTGVLNNDGDNWLVGGVDYFTRSDLGACRGFEMTYNGEYMVTLRHAGTDGGYLDYINIHGSDGTSLTCPVGSFLDSDDSIVMYCSTLTDGRSPNSDCNGDSSFCLLPFNKFMFPGTHNAGTGQTSIGVNDCSYRNHDMTIIEQLDWGIRFFDLDVIYSTAGGYSNCNGLETGHGFIGSFISPVVPYYCFGDLHTLFTDMKLWMDNHAREVVVIYFGKIEHERQTLPKLKQLLLDIFGNNNGSVTMNDIFKTEGDWPTLGRSIEENKRIFVFMDTDNGDVGSDEQFFVKEVKTASPSTQQEKAVTILSTYKAGFAWADCNYLVENSRQKCTTGSDFVKLSLFSAFGKGAGFVECLRSMAEKCNEEIQSSLAACQDNPDTLVNFLLVDYPNHSAQNIVKISHEENLKRINHFDGTSVIP